MDPETKKMLTDTFTLVQENNKMLHHIRRSQKLASFMRLVYWAVIVVIGIAAYYFLTPYFDKAVKVINQSQTDLNNLKNLGGKFGM